MRAHSPAPRLLALVVLSLIAAFGQLAPTVAAAEVVTGSATRSYTHPALGLTVVATDVELPPGPWWVAGATPDAVRQVFLVPRAAPEGVVSGVRMHAIETEKRIATGRVRLQGLYYAAREYARTHNGNGPSTISDLDRAKFDAFLREIDRSPWPEDNGRDVKGPFVFLIPNVPLPDERGTPRGPATPLALELRPFVDDGKHWVLFSDGRTERRPIDAELIARHGLKVTFVQAGGPPRKVPTGTQATYAVYGLLRDASASAVTLSLVDRATAAKVDVRWSLAGARPGAAADLAAWAQARAWEWVPLAERGESSVVSAWLARMGELYGASPAMSQTMRGMPRENRTTDAFAILGGRAALRETLQLQVLRPGAAGASRDATIPLATIKGVEVKSHPFAEMLRGAPGGRLPIADHVPLDRFFVYFAKPSAFFPALDKGGEFLFQTGSLFTTSAMDDDLKGRYLRRLGLSESLGRRFLESGEVTELALVTSDLFFLDGTDVTFLMRLKNADTAVQRLREFGIVDVKDDGITEKALPTQRVAYWARKNDLLCVSTSRTELGAILAARGDATTLGGSAELRYMLTRLPLKKETRAFAYLSDSFVRRMVGPTVKIGQLRRMQARAEMEAITAGALLYTLDGHRDKPDLAKLMKLGYVPAGVAAGDYRLRDDFSVVSPVWGSPAEMTAIGGVPLERVTQLEADAYRTYVEEYSRYWRQYFDPIAMRLDDAPSGALELTTFILPLLDSALYAQVREFVAPRNGSAAAALRVPVVDPEPVLMLSLNLTNDAWVKASGGFSQIFSQYTGIDPGLFDLLGPALHVALQDGDPIIVLGNADLLGSFSGPMVSGDLTNSATIPLLLALLTRPCKIIVQLQDEKAAIDMLRRARTGPGMRRDFGMGTDFRQVEGRDAWIYSLNVPGVVKIRFGIEVKNGYLVLSNIPWSQPVSIKAVEVRALNGADLLISPASVRQGLPGLFAAHSEQSQLASIGGIAALYPLLVTISGTPEDAAARHAALFGARPLHPGQGRWVWKDGRLESSAYGSATRWQQPIYRSDAGDFGLFEGVTRLSVNMQFEDTGLRAIARWIWTGK